MAHPVIAVAVVSRLTAVHTTSSLSVDAPYALFLGKERLREVVQQGVQRTVQADVEQYGEDQEDHHQDQGSNGNGRAKKPDHAKLSKIQSGEELLDSTRIDESTSVEVVVRHKEHVVTVGEVEARHSNCGPPQHERCYA